MSNLDIIRGKLDGGQFTDLEELASGLLSALESIETRASHAKVGEGTPISWQGLLTNIGYWVDEFAELPQTCAHETYAATLETPAEFCEEDAVEGSEYCKEHGE